MARTKIHFDEKRQSLLNEIWSILIQYGYDKTTIAVMIQELNISRGAFYHYFQSKEDCANMAIEAHIDSAAALLLKGDNRKENAVVRFKTAFKCCAEYFWIELKETIFLNQPENTVFHQKLMIAITKQLAPVYAGIVEDGIKSGVFHTAYPLETAEMTIALACFYLDANLFQWEAGCQRMTKVKALEELANRALGTKNYISFFDFYFEAQAQHKENL